MKSFFKRIIILTLMSILILPLNLWVSFMTTPYVGVPIVYAEDWDRESYRKNLQGLSDEELKQTSVDYRQTDQKTYVEGTPEERQVYREIGEEIIGEMDKRIAQDQASAGTDIGGSDSTSYGGSEIPTHEGTQAADAQANTASEGGDGGNAILEGSGEFAQCGIGAILATILSGALSGLITNISTIIQPKVPIINPDDNAKDKAVMIFGIPILPSWDAIGYCLVNMIISYIAQSTIQWVNSGFNGNPAFIQDPAGFAQGIADVEANLFLDQLGGGFLCEPYQQQVQRSVHSIYLQDYPQASTCSFNQRVGEGFDIEGFLEGEYTTYEALEAIVRRENNIYDLTYYAQRQLESNIMAELSEQFQILDWGDGYFSPRGENGLITVPGASVYDAVSRRANLPIDRVLGAKDFDEIINQLVQQLVRVALSELFGVVRGAINEGVSEINQSLR